MESQVPSTDDGINLGEKLWQYKYHIFYRIDMFWNKMIFDETEQNFLVVFINQQINIVPASLICYWIRKYNSN